MYGNLRHQDIIMHPFQRHASCSALALFVASGPALADLTAPQVWDGMESALQGFGYSITATETPTGNGLGLTDVVMRFEAPEDNATVEVRIDSIDLVETGDGSVTMTFPASMPITIDAAPEGEDTVKMVLDYTNSGLELLVSGTPGNMTYTYSADKLSMALTEFAINGAPVSREEARFDLVLDAVAGSTVTATTDGTDITQTIEAAAVRYDLAFNDPDSDDAALVSGSMATLFLSSATTLPEGFDPNDPKALSAGGFSAEGTMGYSDGEMQFAVTEPSGTTSGTTQTGTVRFEFEMDNTALRYDVASTDQAFALSGPDMPLPVDVTMAESAFRITAPIAKAEEPQDMALGLTLRGFEMSDLLWNVFDPGAALPRDPATIALDLTGQVTPFFNLFDPEQMAMLDATGGTPGELNALSLNNLTVEAAGAKLAGSGSFTFDNDDLQTFGGVPRPNGEVNLTLDGANTLIDKLIAMGLLTSEDAMGARMMMSMFAVPGDGPDSLKSTLTINDQGHVLANGMRIQ